MGGNEGDVRKIGFCLCAVVEILGSGRILSVPVAGYIRGEDETGIVTSDRRLRINLMFDSQNAHFPTITYAGLRVVRLPGT